MKATIRIAAALFVVVSLGFMTVAHSSMGLPQVGSCSCSGRGGGEGGGPCWYGGR